MCIFFGVPSFSLPPNLPQQVLHSPNQTPPPQLSYVLFKMIVRHQKATGRGKNMPLQLQSPQAPTLNLNFTFYFWDAMVVKNNKCIAKIEFPSLKYHLFENLLKILHKIGYGKIQANIFFFLV